MPTTPAKKTRKKTKMSDTHKAALAKGREEGRIVRSYLEALEATKPRRGRKRTPDSIGRRLLVIEDEMLEADLLTNLHLVEEKRKLEAELNSMDETIDVSGLEKRFIKVARVYGERKGISYSSWRKVGVSASVLELAKIPRARG
jgi:hypothetical protein